MTDLTDNPTAVNRSNGLRASKKNLTVKILESFTKAIPSLLFIGIKAKTGNLCILASLSRAKHGSTWKSTLWKSQCRRRILVEKGKYFGAGTGRTVVHVHTTNLKAYHVYCLVWLSSPPSRETTVDKLGTADRSGMKSVDVPVSPSTVCAPINHLNSAPKIELSFRTRWAVIRPAQ